MPYWWIDRQVIEPTERDQGIYSIVITDPENSHKRTLDLSGEGLSVPGLINTSGPEFHSALIGHLKNNEQQRGLLSRVKRSSSAACMETGSFWSQNNNKNNNKKKSRFCWFQLNPQGRFLFLLQKMCQHIPKKTSKYKPFLSVRTEYWRSVFTQQHSPPDKAVPESGIFIFSPLHVCVTNLSKAEPCSCLWWDIKSGVERFHTRR